MNSPDWNWIDFEGKRYWIPEDIDLSVAILTTDGILVVDKDTRYDIHEFPTEFS